VRAVTEIDQDPSAFPQLRSYLREKMGKLMEIIVENFFDESQRIPLKVPAMKKMKQMIEQEKNQILILNQKQTISELPTPSKNDIDHFHQFFCGKLL